MEKKHVEKLQKAALKGSKKIMHKEGLGKRPHKEPKTSSSESVDVKYDDSMDEVSSGNERILQWNE